MRAEAIRAFYDLLKRKLVSTQQSPMILASGWDVDSLMASKIMEDMLTKDVSRPKIHPVWCLPDIQRYTTAADDDNENSCIILINCGNDIDLCKALKINFGPQTLFVLDSHRPIHLQNLSDENENVVVLFTKDDVTSKRGQPSGFLLYQLSHSLHFDYDLVWLASISLAEQMVNQRLTNEDRVVDLEPHIKGSDSCEQCRRSLSSAVKNYRIVCKNQPRFILLEHWDLYDSMMYSSYSATGIKTWSTEGEKILEKLFKDMGFAYIHKTKFKDLDLSVQQQLLEVDFMQRYELSDPVYKGVSKIFEDQHYEVSATDMVYCLNALLEDGPWADKLFYDTYATLPLHDPSKLQFGMELAINIQKAIFKEAESVITKGKAVKIMPKFRWMELHDSERTELLGHPHTLTRFCHFLMDVLEGDSPLICVCPSQEARRVLIISVFAFGAPEENCFRTAFRHLAEHFGADQLFESSWILLDNSLTDSFLAKLGIDIAKMYNN